MTIHLTSAAAAHIKTIMAKHPEAMGFRLGVKKTGCSGFAYSVGMAENVGLEDRVFAEHEVSVVVNKGDLGKLDGTEIDFVTEGLNRHFKFHNPNADHYCGCGESFTLKTSEGDDHAD
jgi:iron-sulfur cluster assembly protein